MKVVGRTEVITKTLVGAKYIADDGKEFSNQSDCEQYEAKCKKEAKEKHFKNTVNFITEKPVSISVLDDSKSAAYIKRFETEDEFRNTFKILNCYTSGVDHYAYINDYTLEYATLPTFPATFLIKKNIY